MTFIDELMIHFGVGAATLTTRTEQANYGRGTDIPGTLHLQGGVSEQRIERIIVKLMEYHQYGKNGAWEALDLINVAANIHIAPGEARTYPFTLHIPDTAYVTSSLYSMNCRVVSEADILWAANPVGSLEIKVLPQEEILILDDALRHLRFVPEQPEFTSVSSDTDGMVTKTYTSPSTLHEQITNATLQVQVNAAKVLGRFILNHREVHLRDYVRALKGEDKQEFLIEVPRASLLAEDGKMLAVAMFQEILDKALVLPDNPQNWLLRGASRPPDGGDTLLRAAQGVASAEADTLLRADNADANDQDNNQDILKKAEQEAHQALYDAFVPIQIGYEEIFDGMKQKILKEKYGVDWQPPKR